MKFLKFPLLIVFSLCLISASAQVNFQPGYVVLTSGDTVNGFIDYKNWKQNPIRISFKKSLDDAASEFSAIQLLYFFLSKQNEGYRGATLQVDQSPVNFDKVTATSHMLSEEQSVFLRVLLAGPATLYYSYDHKDHYFLQKGDSKIEELIYRLKLVTGDAASNKPATVSKIESFKFQLINAFSDCQGLNNDIQKLKFTRAAISSIVKKYNECKGSIVETTHVEKNNSSAQWGIIAGTALATYTVSTNHEYLENAKFGNDNSFVGGVFLNIPFDRRRGATSFYCDLTYQRFGLNSLSSISNPAYQTTYTNAFSASFTTLKMGGRLALPWKTVRPFVELGLNAGLIGDGRFSGVKQRIDGDVVMTTEKTDYALRNNYVGVWGGAGVSIKRFAIEAVYILPNGVVRPADISDRIRIASFQASYNFGKR